MATSNPSDPLSRYAIGHTRGAVNAHAGRSAARHAAFLLPHIAPHMTILDIGCGPGSITCDLAQLVPEGSVTGIDLSPHVIEIARTAAQERGVANASFDTGDVLEGLSFPDNSFDLVFCHQLLNHLSDPVAAVREMKRLCREDGIVALREGIMHVWYPQDPRLMDMDRILAEVMRAGGAAQPGAGMCLPSWAKEAGFETDEVKYTVSGSPTISQVMRDRTRGFVQDTFGEGSALRGKAKLIGIEDKRINDFYAAAMEWCDIEDAFQVVVCGEVICKMSGRQ